jgi:hypothetical protein
MAVSSRLAAVYGHATSKAAFQRHWLSGRGRKFGKCHTGSGDAHIAEAAGIEKTLAYRVQQKTTKPEPRVRENFKTERRFKNALGVIQIWFKKKTFFKIRFGG